jgi:hypothetical protein
MSIICGTRIIKNANQIRAVDPAIFAKKQPNEGFSSVVPIEILRQFHNMQPDQLQAFPALLAVKQKILAQTTQHGVSPKEIIFSDPSFKGTLYLVNVTFRTKTATLSVSDADIAVMHQYLTMAAPPIAQYAAQYGEHRGAQNRAPPGARKMHQWKSMKVPLCSYHVTVYRSSVSKA